MNRALGSLLLALGSTLAQGQGLSDLELARQLTYSALHVADWQQTRRIAASPGRWYETNPILGKYPTQAEVNRYFAGTLLAHWAITYALPPRWREPFQAGTIVLQASVVQRNYALGISARF